MSGAKRRSLRHALVHRDGSRCVACSTRWTGRNLEIHHITPRSEGGTDHVDNLVLLCRGCHSEEHA